MSAKNKTLSFDDWEFFYPWFIDEYKPTRAGDYWYAFGNFNKISHAFIPCHDVRKIHGGSVKLRGIIKRFNLEIKLKKVRDK